MNEKQLRLVADVQWTRLDWVKQQNRIKDYLALIEHYVKDYEPHHAYGTVGWDNEYREWRIAAERLETVLSWIEVLQQPVG